MNITKLTPLPIRFKCYKVLPLVYDESLSYYEQLCKIAKTLNETIKAIDALNEITGEVPAIIEKVNELSDNIVTFEEHVNDALNDINNTIAEFDTRFNELETELTAKIESNLNELKAYVDLKLSEIEKDLNDILNKEISAVKEELLIEFNAKIKELIDNIPDLTTIEVIDPVTGKLSKVQIALDNLFMNTRYNALTVDEWNHLHLTVDKCNAMMYHSAPSGWSIITWLSKAKVLLDKNLKHRMANAINGKWQDFKRSIEDNTDMLRVCGCLSASEFGALSLTVDEFNNVGANCYQLAWESNRIFV